MIKLENENNFQMFTKAIKKINDVFIKNALYVDSKEFLVSFNKKTTEKIHVELSMILSELTNKIMNF